MSRSVPKLIKVKRRLKECVLEIDGEEFPWDIAEKPPPSTSVDPNMRPSLTVTIVADRVVIDDDLGSDDGERIVFASDRTEYG